MADSKKVTERVEEPVDPDKAPAESTKSKKKSKRDPRNLVYVYSTRSGRKLPNPVPETWLDQFPYLKERPQNRKKAGK